MYDPSATIEIIQGDSLELEFTLRDEDDLIIDPEIIDSVYFTCNAVHCQHKLTYDEDHQSYILTLPPSMTAKMEKGSWTYDITVVLIGDKHRTATYNGTFIVHQKINVVNYEEG